MPDPAIPADALDLARRLSEAYVAEREGHFAAQLRDIRHDAARRGRLDSGMYVMEVAEACSFELRIRALATWQFLQRVMGQLGLSGAEAGSDLKAALSQGLDEQEAGLIKQFAVETRHVEQLARPGLIEQARRRVQQQLEAEVDLYAANMRRRSEAAANPSTVQFNAPVGAVQFGPSSTASVTQTASSGDLAALARAVQAVADALARVDRLTEGAPKPEVVEIVQEAGAELEKPTPNRLRVTQLLQGVASTIQTTAALRPAYETLKAALIPFGVTLP